MPRARNIKPGLFVNDELAEVEPLGRLLFIGLWTIADREGRLKDRPKKIKAQTLPFDDCDVDNLLQQLEDHGFIYRYESGGCRLIQILNFTKHQNPHMKEAESELPAPDLYSADTIQELNEHTTNPADSLNLIPDTLYSENGGDVGDKKVAEVLYNDLWKLYPRKLGKSGVSLTKKKEILRVGYDEMARCIERFCDHMKKEERPIDKYPYGSTFFNGGYIDYLDENYEEHVKPKSKEVYL